MLQFIRSEEICELEKRINAKDVSNNVEGRFKVLKVPYQLLEKEQFQHIVKDFADQYKLPYADFVKDPVKWDAEFGIATWKQMMTEMEFETSWTSHIYLAGGVAGYLTGRFFRATRSFQPVSVGVEELKCDQVPVGATLIMDQDLIIFLARSSVSPKKNPSGVRRRREEEDSDDETSDQKLQRVDPVAITDIDWTDIQETLQDVEHKKPCSLYIIKRVQDVYIEKIDALEARFSSIIEDLKAEIEDLKKKREAENARIDSVAVDIDAELKKREEKLQRQEALLKEKDSIVITLRQEVQAQKTELETQQNTPSQVQDLQSKNSVLESKIKLTETELTEALSNVQILEGEVRELKTNINSQQTSVAAPITKLPAPNLQVKQSVSVLENDSSSEDESPGQDDSMRSAKRSKGRRVIAALGKPVLISKYGIPIWNESETTLIEHLSVVTMGLELAKENQVTKTGLTSLLFQSLPQKYNWAREYLTADSEIDQRILQLIELLVGDKSQLISDFMKVQRRRDEQLLQYFTKLKRMYAYATNKQIKDLEKEAVAIQLLVQKLKDSMETIFSTEFSKRIEAKMDAGKLEMTDISVALMKISRQMTQAGHLAPVSSNIMAVKTTCAYCGKVGHMAKKCWKKRRENGGTRIEDNSMGTSRESKTDGRQGQKKSFRCYGCNEIGHIRRNCPRKAGKS